MYFPEGNAVVCNDTAINFTYKWLGNLIAQYNVTDPALQISTSDSWIVALSKIFKIYNTNLPVSIEAPNYFQTEWFALYYILSVLIANYGGAGEQNLFSDDNVPRNNSSNWELLTKILSVLWNNSANPGQENPFCDDNVPRNNGSFWEILGKIVSLTSYIYNPIAQAYFESVKAQSGNDVLDKYNVNRFIIGLQSLGVLNYLVEGWILRSNQNTGTGTIACGLMGRYDQTLMNGPTWADEGIVFTSGDSSFSSNNSIQINSEYTMLTIYSYNLLPTSGLDDIVISSDPYQGGILFMGSNPTDGLSFIGGGDINGDGSSQINEGTIPTINQFYFTLAAVNPSNVYFQVNQNTPKNVSGSYSAVKNHVRINGDSSIGRYANCTIAAHILFNKDISSLSINLNNIYKQTIGQGLGL